MIQRVRRAAPHMISVGLMLCSGGLIAQATSAAADPGVSRAELYATLGTAGAVVFAAFWVLLRAHSADLSASVERLEKNVSRYFDALRLHDESPHAHGAASKENHLPIFERLDDIDSKVDSILHARRDPFDSREHRRRSDPEEEDHAAERGRA